MKRRTFAQSVALAAAAQMLAAPADAQTKELTIGIDTSYMPFEFKRDGEYVGFDIDLWAEIAKDQGLKYRLQPMDFNGIIPALQTRNIDAALASIFIKEDRRKVIDFSDPYYESGLSAMVVATRNDIKSFQDLNGKTIASKSGTAAIDWIKGNLKTKDLQQFPNIDQAYMALEAGRVDAVVNDTPNVLYFITTEGKGKFRTTGETVMASPVGIGFPKNSALVADVNKALARMKADGRYAAIHKKWFGASK